MDKEENIKINCLKKLSIHVKKRYLNGLSSPTNENSVILIHPHVVLNLLLSFVEHKRRYFEECW